jgi:hypothetical protein
MLSNMRFTFTTFFPNINCVPRDIKRANNRLYPHCLIVRAMETFPRPIYVPSKQGKHPVIQVRSTRFPGSVLEFSFKAAKGESMYYRCIGCLKKNNGTVASVTIKDGKFLTDPERSKVPHSCDPESTGAVLASRYMIEIRADVQTSRKRPREAFNEAVSNASKRFKDEEESTVSELKFELASGGGFASKRRCLSRNRNKFVPKNVTIRHIPPNLSITKDGEKFLQVRGHHISLLYFYSLYMRGRVRHPKNT